MTPLRRYGISTMPYIAHNGHWQRASEGILKAPLRIFFLPSLYTAGMLRDSGVLDA